MPLPYLETNTILLLIDIDQQSGEYMLHFYLNLINLIDEITSLLIAIIVLCNAITIKWEKFHFVNRSRVPIIFLVSFGYNYVYSLLPVQNPLCWIFVLQFADIVIFCLSTDNHEKYSHADRGSFWRTRFLIKTVSPFVFSSEFVFKKSRLGGNKWEAFMFLELSSRFFHVHSHSRCFTQATVHHLDEVHLACLCKEVNTIK